MPIGILYCTRVHISVFYIYIITIIRLFHARYLSTYYILPHPRALTVGTRTQVHTYRAWDANRLKEKMPLWAVTPTAYLEHKLTYLHSHRCRSGGTYCMLCVASATGVGRRRRPPSRSSNKKNNRINNRINNGSKKRMTTTTAVVAARKKNNDSCAPRTRARVTPRGFSREEGTGPTAGGAPRRIVRDYDTPWCGSAGPGKSAQKIDGGDSRWRSRCREQRTIHA